MSNVDITIAALSVIVGIIPVVLIFKFGPDASNKSVVEIQFTKIIKPLFLFFKNNNSYKNIDELIDSFYIDYFEYIPNSMLFIIDNYKDNHTGLIQLKTETIRYYKKFSQRLSLPPNYTNKHMSLSRKILNNANKLNLALLPITFLLLLLAILLKNTAIYIYIESSIYLVAFISVLNIFVIVFCFLHSSDDYK